MATLDNVNIFAPKDPETGKTYQLFDTEAIKQKQEQSKQNYELIRQQISDGNIEQAYEGFSQLPFIEQMAVYMTPGLGNVVDAYEAQYFGKLATKEAAEQGMKTPQEIELESLTTGLPPSPFRASPQQSIFRGLSGLAGLSSLVGIGELPSLVKGAILFGGRKLGAIPSATDMGAPTIQAADTTGGGGIGGLPPTTLDEDVNKFARDGDFVSPTIEALIRNAPKNIKGKQIIEYLNSKGAPSAGIKPKELPYLGIERFIEENPNATLPEVIEHAGKNKVQVGEVVYKDIGTEGSDFYFDTSTPEFDPKSGEIIYQHIIDDIVYDVKNKQGAYVDDILDSYVQRLTPDELINDYGYVDPNDFTVDDMINRINKSVESGASTETLEDIIEEKARDIYFLNPYKLIKPEGEGFTGGDMTFAFGNSEVGYQNFIDGERIDIKDYGYDDVAYSATEAEVRLQRILDERGDIEFSYDSKQKYKRYVDATLPGGKNYSEKVYTFENTDEYHSGGFSHFDEDTQIAHKLGRDRLLEDGTLSVHADEIQSDLHKEGREKGYKDSEQDVDDLIKLGRMSSKISMEFKTLKDKVLPVIENSDLNRDILQNIKNRVANAEELYAKSPQNRFSLIRLNDARKIMYETLNNFSELYGGNIKITVEDIAAFTPFDDAFRPAFELATTRQNRVPNFPFKGDDYGEMVLKKMILDAINEGKDAISVSGSYPILERYNMTPGSNEAQFFERFYDLTLPKSMNKIAKKYGGKFERGKLDFEDTFAITINEPNDDFLDANILRITPEMKQKIIKEGLPLFNMGGKVTKRKFMDKPIEGNRREM